MVMAASSVINHANALMIFFLTNILQVQGRITLEIKKTLLIDDSIPLSQRQLSSSSFFNLVSLNPHSTHLYITELPISFSGGISPPQHAHFMSTGLA
jgi:hypothetical protein